MPGQVVKILVAEGEAVRRGQPLMVLEAMKMEIRINAPRDGHVTRLLCQPGQVVERGQTLLELTSK
jgi:biotin carboxyl carrier protein